MSIGTWTKHLILYIGQDMERHRNNKILKKNAKVFIHVLLWSDCLGPSPNSFSYVEAPAPPWNRVRKWSLWEGTRSWEWSLRTGISTLPGQERESLLSFSLAPSATWGCTKMAATRRRGRGLSPESHSLTSDFRSMRYSYAPYKPLGPWCSLWQLKLTKTYLELLKDTNTGAHRDSPDEGHSVSLGPSVSAHPSYNWGRNWLPAGCQSSTQKIKGRQLHRCKHFMISEVTLHYLKHFLHTYQKASDIWPKFLWTQSHGEEW